ncbi:MAG: hypothetical protein ACE5OZ_12235 [Candidatus Heimdallarchaeota archaeon]
MIALVFLALQGFLWFLGILDLAEFGLRILQSVAFAYLGMTRTKKQKKAEKVDKPIIDEMVLDKKDFIETETLASGIRKEIPIGHPDNRCSLNWEMAFVQTKQTQGNEFKGIRKIWWLIYYLAGIESELGYISLGDAKNQISVLKEPSEIHIHFQDLPQDPSVHMSSEAVQYLQNTEDIPSTNDLFNQLVDFVRYSVELKENHHYTALALYIMATYLFEVCSAFPYLSVVGIKRSGKSRLAIVLGAVCYHAKKTVSASGATIFRYSHTERATLIFDVNNLGKRLHKESETLDFIKEGYKQGAYVGRQVEKRRGQHETKFYNAYSPKIFLTLQGTDEILEDRALTISMVRTLDENIKNRSEIEIERIGHSIRDQLYAWKLWMAHQYNESKIPQINGIDGRLLELARPLIWLAYEISPEVGTDLINFLFEQREEKIQDESESLEVQILEILQESLSDHRRTSLKTVKSKPVRIKVEDIKIKCANSGLKDWKGDDVGSRLIGRILKSLGFKKHRNKYGVGYLFTEEDIANRLAGFNMVDVIAPTTSTAPTTPKDEDDVVNAVDADKSGLPDAIPCKGEINTNTPGSFYLHYRKDGDPLGQEYNLTAFDLQSQLSSKVDCYVKWKDILYKPSFTFASDAKEAYDLYRWPHTRKVLERFDMDKLLLLARLREISLHQKPKKQQLVELIWQDQNKKEESA